MSKLLAQFYNGSGVGGGINLGSELPNGGGSIRTFILNALFTVLSYMGLVAVIIIVIGGIYLLVGDGEQREKVQKMILYMIVGLLLIVITDGFVWIVSSF